MPRRRRTLDVTGLAVPAAVAAVALTSMASVAQTPLAGPSVDLLQPSLDGNPATPPRFRRPRDTAASARDQAPAAGTFTAPSRIGATPVYGSPSGFGAGDTGFDSTNARRRKTLAQAPAPALAGAPQPETTFEPVPMLTSRRRPKPAGAAAEAAAGNPSGKGRGAARRGAAAAARSTAGEQSAGRGASADGRKPARRRRAGAAAARLRTFREHAAARDAAAQYLAAGNAAARPLPIAEVDPYAALGIRAGSFLILPAVELSAGYDTNPATRARRSPAPRTSSWHRNCRSAPIGSAMRSPPTSAAPIPSTATTASRRRSTALISTRKSTAASTSRATRRSFSRTASLSPPTIPAVQTLRPGSPSCRSIPRSAARSAWCSNSTGSSVSLKGTFDRSMYENSALTDGESASNADRNFDQYAGILRVGYEIDPGLKPFVEVQRRCSASTTRSSIAAGCERNSIGTSAKVGGACRSVRLAHRRDGGRISRAHLQGPDAAGHQRHDRRRLADLAGDAR